MFAARGTGALTAGRLGRQGAGILRRRRVGALVLCFMRSEARAVKHILQPLL